MNWKHWYEMSTLEIIIFFIFFPLIFLFFYFFGNITIE